MVNETNNQVSAFTVYNQSRIIKKKKEKVIKKSKYKLQKVVADLNPKDANIKIKKLKQEQQLKNNKLKQKPKIIETSNSSGLKNKKSVVKNKVEVKKNKPICEYQDKRDSSFKNIKTYNKLTRNIMTREKRNRFSQKLKNLNKVSTQSDLKVLKKVSKSQTTLKAKNIQNHSLRLNEINTNVFENEDSVKCGEDIFSWLIQPVNISNFFKENWEKLPLIVKRNVPNYYSDLLSCEQINRVLRTKQLYFTKNIDITSYSKETGLRETHNPPGRATAPLVWDFYATGCSIRLLNPQTFFHKIHVMNGTLQEYFECFVGANVYLTPKDSQGFAPHFDDIEAFVLQIEGKKKWKLYSPRSPKETLPRYSSGNFSEDELGPPFYEVILEAGDMMYFPRGFIHQAEALPEYHSLHVTVSMYQKNSWADLLELLLPAALKSAVDEDVSFREGLPMHYLSNMGIVHCDKNTEFRKKFMEKVESLIGKLIDHAPIDAAVDQLGKKFIHDALPPILLQKDTENSAFGDGASIHDGNVCHQVEMDPDTRIKLIKYNCLRIVNEDDTLRIYHSISNSLEYHGEELQYLEITPELAPAIDALISSYPNYMAIQDLPIDDEIVKLQIANDLWDNGLIVTEEPLSHFSD